MMKPYRLSIDLGTNSLGWAIYNLDEHNEPISIENCDVRIFSDGRDEKSKTSLKAGRRLTRSASRRRDRFLRRQKKLINALVDIGLMPADEGERRSLALKNPYVIRKTALDQQVDDYDMGRALFHINQRRGFKSNRKTQDSETGLVNQSIKLFKDKLKAVNARTVGEFFADRQEKKQTVRARRSGTTQEDYYEFYPNRAMSEEEFDKLWTAQKAYSPNLYNDDNRDKLKDIIYFQRKLKPQESGKCQFLPKEDRLAKAHPAFQNFRIYQELANLEWIDKWGNSTKITTNRSLRDAFANKLKKEQKLSFTSMRKIMKKMNIVNYDVQFNLESERRKEIDGNLTSYAMCLKKTKNRLGGIEDLWNEFDEETQTDLILLLLDDEIEDEEVEIVLADKFGLPEDKIEACLNISLPAGYGSLSLAAIEIILPKLINQCLGYTNAVIEAEKDAKKDAEKNAEEAVGFGAASMYNKDKPLKDKLEYYGKALEGHVIGGMGESNSIIKNVRDQEFYGAIPNPTVHIALNQVRQVTNELIRRYGKPAQIVLEIARDLPLGVEGKAKIEKRQKEGQAKNEEVRAEIEKQGYSFASRKDQQKYRLWEELNSDPCNRRCLFTGNQIGIKQLFSEEIEIEHLLPYSQTLDDSMANKTVCFRKANRDKGNQSPFGAFGMNLLVGYDWEGIMERVRGIPKNKRWRFGSDAMKKWADLGGFLERQLNDIRYISSYTHQYLTTIVPENQIWVVTGQLTAMLRKRLGLNSVLHDHNQQEQSDDGKPKKKNREDHRHHAVDAVVIGLISRSMLKRVSDAATNSESMNLDKLFDFNEIEPWEDFRSDVKHKIEQVVISHRGRRKNQGPLHNETAYGVDDKSFNPKGSNEVVHRIPVNTINKQNTIEKIRDPLIRESLLAETEFATGKGFEEAVRIWCRERNIRRIRIVEKLSVIPIKNKYGKIFKAYKGDGNAYMDIYAHPNTGKWMGEIVSRFDANNSKGKYFIPLWQKDFPALKRKMRLRINDILCLTESGEEKLYRIQKISKDEIIIVPLREANVDARNRDKNDVFKFVSKAPSALQKSQACKVHISPTGLMRMEK